MPPERIVRLLVAWGWALIFLYAAQWWMASACARQNAAIQNAATQNPAAQFAAAGGPAQTGATGSAAPSPAAANPPSSAPQPHAGPPELRAPELRFTVLLDPAHGGADNGAAFNGAGNEKDFNLALALRLRALLSARGIASTLTRAGDATVDATTRATVANRAQPAACVLLHATPSGNGIHLYTSSLQATPTPDPRRAFLPWQTAQASYVTQSLRLESDLNSALTRLHMPVLLGRTSLAPLDNMTCPAVAIEIAPLDARTPVTDPAYQQQILGALASALVNWRNDWRLQP